MKAWYMEQPFQRLRSQLSQKDLIKLRRFYTVQLELSQALLDGKRLGICKTTTSGKNPLRDILQEEEGLTGYILSRNDSKETSL